METCPVCKKQIKEPIKALGKSFDSERCAQRYRKSYEKGVCEFC